MRKALVAFVVAIFVAQLCIPAALARELPAELQINWNERHRYAFFEQLFDQLARTYPRIVRTYPIGHSWRERPLLCAELSSGSGGAKHKTGIAVFGNIHGGEQESGESAAYFAWWLATNYDTSKEVKRILDNYVIYVIPVINPDGYEQSFIYNTRQNLRPMDHNGDGKPFSDPYADTNGDGVIAEVYVGTPDSDPKDRVRIGMESPDWDKNGKPGDDPKASDIDLNRTFDYMWNRLDVDRTPVIGADSWKRAGPDAASEPEVQAVQDFLLTHPVHALVTLHTGEQSVLWPWCYTPEPPADAKFMEEVAAKMVKAYSETTGRKAYYKQSNADYPTTAELIDWAYGRLGIHAYTMEVYVPGKAVENGPLEKQCTWNNELPEEKWIFMGKWNGIDNVWFRNTPRAQMVGKAPPEQGLMCEGVKNAILEMIRSEPHGEGAKVPEYLLWRKIIQDV